MNKKASRWLKRAGYLGTDDLEIINYNNNSTNMVDIETVNYNNDTNFDDQNNINLKKHQGNWRKKSSKNIGIHQEKDHIAGLIRKCKRKLFLSNRYQPIQKIGLQGKQKMKLSLLNRYLCILWKGL